MVLESLGWGKEPREDINFVLESRLNFTQPMDVNWRNLFSIKMSPISAQLVTLGQNTLAPTLHVTRDIDTCPRSEMKPGSLKRGKVYKIAAKYYVVNILTVLGCIGKIKII